ncbi:MAG: monovalent cation/H(+) antiporter subunit G [Notoacmeibacter sp.]
MLADFANYFAAMLILTGSFFALVGAVGLVRLPDVYARSHAASKAGTIGSGLALLAVAVSAPETYLATRAFAGLLFFLLTAPVSAHLLMRASYNANYPMWQGAVVDDLSKANEKPSDN